MTKLPQTFGFIGAGNMARAILSGMINAHLIDPTQAIVSDAAPEPLEIMEQVAQPRIAADNAAVLNEADVITFAVKPFHMDEVCREISPHMRPSQLFISICAGIPTEFIERRLGAGARVIRVMPNTPALIQCGSAGVARGKAATDEDMALVLRIFNAIGVAVELPEKQLDLITGLTGSGPAYVFYFTEALIAAAVEQGLDAESATELVRQMVYGASRMALESNQPLHELRSQVTTKGGTTEAGLKRLEEGDFRALVSECVAAATARSRELSAGK